MTAIYFTTAGDVRPCELSTHAIDRFLERHGHALDITTRARQALLSRGSALGDCVTAWLRLIDQERWEIATRLLWVAACNAQIETWRPGDLDGLGQGVWVGYAEGLAVRLSVDGNGLVRTVLP